MTNRTSGIAFTLCLLLALIADSLPLWTLFGVAVPLAAIAAILALAELARGKKKDRPALPTPDGPNGK